MESAYLAIWSTCCCLGFYGGLIDPLAGTPTIAGAGRGIDARRHSKESQGEIGHSTNVANWHGPQCEWLHRVPKYDLQACPTMVAWSVDDKATTLYPRHHTTRANCNFIVGSAVWEKWGQDGAPGEVGMNRMRLRRISIGQLPDFTISLYRTPLPS